MKDRDVKQVMFGVGLVGWRGGMQRTKVGEYSQCILYTFMKRE
jgi:hypothetical protein